MVTWQLKFKLVESMDHTDAWFIQQGVRLIKGSTYETYYYGRYEPFEHTFTHLCVMKQINS